MTRLIKKMIAKICGVMRNGQRKIAAKLIGRKSVEMTF